MANEGSSKPCLFATFMHSKSNNGTSDMVECKRTSDGRPGKRPATYEMKLSSNNLEYTSEEVRDNYCQGYEWTVAIRNRRTGKTIFSPFSMVHFRPKIRMSEEELNVATKIDSSNYEEMRTRLIMEFGHKKQKQMLNSSLRNAVDEKATDHLLTHAMKHIAVHEDAKRAKLESTPSQSSQDFTSTPSSGVQISSALPPCNLQAKQPSEIYNIEDLVPENILDALKPEAEHFLLLSPKEAQEADHPPLVMAILKMTSATKDVEDRTKRTAYCLYLGYLIRLHRQIGGRSRFVTPSVFSGPLSMPQAVLNDFLCKFTSAGGDQPGGWKNASKLTVSQVHKDFLLSNIAVLLLILSGQYAFNVNKAAKDLGMSEGKVTINKLATICRALGCRLEKHSQSGEQICVLQQPPKQKNALLGKQGFGAKGGGRGKSL